MEIVTVTAEIIGATLLAVWAPTPYTPEGGGGSENLPAEDKHDDGGRNFQTICERISKGNLL